MPEPLISTTVETLSEFAAAVERALDDAVSDTLWFRGVSDAAYQLVPRFYRREPDALAADLRKKEELMIERFRHRSLPFLSTRYESSLEALFIMQHYGIPTRLLDWSENAFVALWFAMTYADKAIRELGQSPAAAAVWILDPVAWNRGALHSVGHTGGVFLPSDPLLTRRYAPSSDDLTGADAVALFGPHNSARIVAQRGVFTIAGALRTPMENTFAASSAYAPACLRKIEVPAEAVSNLTNVLTRIGFSESMMFPDLDGFARETNRLFNF